MEVTKWLKPSDTRAAESLLALTIPSTKSWLKHFSDESFLTISRCIGRG
jgi:hypothetical protein